MNNFKETFIGHHLFYCISILLAALLPYAAQGNDGVFYVNGNHLVPIQETDIALAREVLSIRLCDDGYAEVDVQYELMNNGRAKTVTMGFEAEAPYNDDAAFSRNGIHPYISDFTVEMNHERLAYMNAVVKTENNQGSNFIPLDLDRWKSYGEVKMRDGDDLPHNALLYDAQADSLISFAYAYYFIARFNPGLNTVHHTYRYRMSYGVGRTFEVPYWLLPALRWANRQIDDFTLRISAPNTAKHFFVADSLFAESEFVVTEGTGKTRKIRSYDELCIETVLRDGTVEWHARNFRPRGNMTIQSAERLYSADYVLGSFYDRSDRYLPGAYLTETGKTEESRRILQNLPYASRGFVFKDRKLRRYFEKFWWYMPDPAWQPDTAGFTPRERKLIQDGE